MEATVSRTAEVRPTTLAGLLREGVSILSENGIQNAEHEAVWIMDFALGASRLTLRLEGQRQVTAEDRSRAMELFGRRAAREPLQFILGTQEFCGLEFEVGPAALIPRPETELLVEEVLRHGFSSPHPVIADIGTGSGCVAVALARALPSASLYATDLSPAALDLARRNAARHAVEHRVVFLTGDLLGPLRARGLEGRLAAVVSNPPYIADGEVADLPPDVRSFEPTLALAGGVDGLALHRRLLEEAPEFLTPGGLLALEVGLGQAHGLRHMALAGGGYGRIRTASDAAGIERVVCLQKKC
ncbi:MAG: peptide chain release factor N(5)-glutamine methyltransferase [Nitrospiraceae bacterium]